MLERTELRQIPGEQQGDGPVERDPYLPAERRHVEQVIRAVQEPRREASDAHPERIGAPLVVTERAEHPLVPVPERLQGPAVQIRGDVLREALRLAKGM